MTVRAWEGALVRLRAVLGSAFAHRGLGYGADAPAENRHASLGGHFQRTTKNTYRQFMGEASHGLR